MPPFMRSSSKATSAGISTPVNSRGMAGLLSKLVGSRERLYANLIRENEKGLFLPGLGNQFLDFGQNAGDDDVDALGARMHSVLLVKIGLRGNPVKKEWVVKDIVGLGKLRVDRVEALDVVGTKIARRPHAGEQSRQTAGSEPGKNVGERCLGAAGIDTAERIIGAKLDDDGIDIAGQHPVEPVAAVAAGVAGNPAIDHPRIKTFGFERRFELDRKRIIRGQAEAGRQTVAEGENIKGGGAERKRGQDPSERDDGDEPQHTS